MLIFASRNKVTKDYHPSVKPPKPLGGFTFVEVMLVILMIGLMTSAVVGNLFSVRNQDEVDKEARRFAAVFNLASEYALLNNLELGVRIESDGYQFLAFDGQRWVELPANDTLQNYRLPEQVSVELLLDDLPIDKEELLSQVDLDALFDGNKDSMFEGDFRAENKTQKIIPQLLIFSSGEITPFIAEFSLNDQDFEPQYVPAIQVEGKYSVPVRVLDNEDEA